MVATAKSITVTTVVKSDDVDAVNYKQTRVDTQRFSTMAAAYAFINRIRQSRRIGANTVIGNPTIQG